MTLSRCCCDVGLRPTQRWDSAGSDRRVATTLHRDMPRRRGDRRAPGSLPARLQRRRTSPMSPRRDGRGRQARRRAHRRHQDRRQARRRGGLRAAAIRRACSKPGARAAARSSPSQYMECEISFRLTRDLPARRTNIPSRRCSTRWKAARVRAGRQPLPRSEIGDGQHAVRILRRPHRQRRHGVRRLPQGLAEIRLHQDPRVDEAGRPRPSSRKTGGHPTGNPAKPAVVLANLRRGTTGLKAGTFIVTGSFTGFHAVEIGSR